MKNIAVMIETSRAYGRMLMEGIAAHAQEAGDWKLLMTTDLPVKTIAANCGYGSAQYFSRVFLNAYGRTPLAFRPQSRQ